MSIIVSNRLSKFAPARTPYFQNSNSSFEFLWLVDAGYRKTSKYFYLTIPYRRIERYVNLFDYAYKAKLNLDIYKKDKKILNLKFKPVERTLKMDSLANCKESTYNFNYIYISMDNNGVFSKNKISYANIYFDFSNSSYTYNTENNEKLYKSIYNNLINLINIPYYMLEKTDEKREFLESLSCIYRLEIE